MAISFPTINRISVPTGVNINDACSREASTSETTMSLSAARPTVMAPAVLVGLGANLWMTTHLGKARMSADYISTGAVIVLVLGQLAVLWPAVRAASIDPLLATRGL